MPPVESRGREKTPHPMAIGVNPPWIAPSSATRATGHHDGQPRRPAGFAAAHGWATSSSCSNLLRSRSPNARTQPFVGSTDAPITLASLSQTQRTVRTATCLVGVVTVLAVVLPAAHRANLIASASAQGETVAARTAIRRLRLRGLADILKGHGVYSGLTTDVPASQG